MTSIFSVTFFQPKVVSDQDEVELAKQLQQLEDETEKLAVTRMKTKMNLEANTRVVTMMWEMMKQKNFS